MRSGSGQSETNGNEALTASLVRQIRELIESGELSPGSKLLPERELAQKLNVSRSSLRQAFKALETMGVLSSRVGVGTFVRSDLTQGDLLSEPMEFAVRANRISPAKLFELRRLLDVEVAGLAAARADEEALAAMAKEIERMRVNAQRPSALADADYGFHLAVVRACRNEAFELIYSPVSQLLWKDLSHRIQSFEPTQIVEVHQAIFDAIKSRDVKRARRTMRDHLEIGYGAYFKNGGSA